MSGALVRLALVVILLAGGARADERWFRFRGPNGSGVSDSTGLPVEFGPSKNLLWKTPVPFGRSSPVIAGNHIFLTATEGEKLITLCLERTSGRVLWRREIVRPRATPIFKANDPASPSPVTDGKNVYVFFADLGLVSFGPDGKERWRVPLGPFDAFYGLGASPILAGDTLLLLCDTRTDGFLIAVNTRNGRTRWRVERKETMVEGYSSPVLWQPKGQPAQVIVLGTHRMEGYAVATGERLWWVRGLAAMPVGSPIVSSGVVFASTWGSDTPEGPTFDEWLKSDANGDGRISREEAKSFEEFGFVDRNKDGFIDRAEWDHLRNASVGEYGLVAVRPGGRGDQTQTSVAWRDKKVYNTLISALIYKDVLYVAKSAGIISTLDPQTGEILKVERPKEAVGEYYASPVAADDKVYFLGESGKVVVLQAGRQWDVLAVNDLGEECHATPAIVDGKIYIRTREALYAFGKP